MLSIDGGGVRGIFPATVLERLQDYVYLHSSYQLHNLFDYMGGTSSGALLSLGLGVPQSIDDTRARYKASDLVEWFTDKNKKLFDERHGEFYGYRPLHKVIGQYDALPLEEFLKKTFKETTFSAALTPTLVSTLRRDSFGQLPYHFSYNSPQAQRDEVDDYPMWQVARASSFAPYFKSYEMQMRRTRQNLNLLPGESSSHITAHFYDAYISDNNPTILTYQALQNYVEDKIKNNMMLNPMTEQNCIVISLGTGQTTIAYDPKIYPIQARVMQQDQIVQGYFNRFNRHGQKNYYRFQPILNHDIGLKDPSPESLDHLYSAARTLCGDSLEQWARRLVNNKTARDPKELW